MALQRARRNRQILRALTVEALTKPLACPGTTAFQPGVADNLTETELDPGGKSVAHPVKRLEAGGPRASCRSRGGVDTRVSGSCSLSGPRPMVGVSRQPLPTLPAPPFRPRKEGLIQASEKATPSPRTAHGCGGGIGV